MVLLLLLPAVAEKKEKKERQLEQAKTAPSLQLRRVCSADLA